MIALNNITVDFGKFQLFTDISFLITPTDKIGLVGKNGAGKTTLLKVIMKMEQASSGSVSMPKETKIGYLPQQMVVTDSQSVFEETKTAFNEINDLQKEVSELSHQLAVRQDYESDYYMEIINRLAVCNERLAILGEAGIEAEIEKVLLGLGFQRSDLHRQTAEFSGGWRMRIELAKLLLQKPHVFLLDEPTNHLDIESIEWLEGFLSNYEGAVLVISHDKKFLDQVTRRTVEISMGKIYDYKANYSEYVKLRKERREQQMAAYLNQRKQIEDTEKFIERFRYKATKAVQVQSRIKQLGKTDRIEIEEEDKSSINFRFPPAPRSGTIVVEGKSVHKSYDDLLVLSDLHFVIERGEMVAFVGKNGEGKTTLARMIVGELEYSGELRIGHNVTIGYYAQNQDRLLNEDKTVFETLDAIAVGDVRTKIRDILGSFLFSGESVDKKVSVLSGGERARLALAKLLLQPYSLLILDEPTNHLDMRSKDILKQALKNYDGTLILVSHDRDFLDGLTDKIFEFTHKNIREHLGSIYEFLRKKRMETLQELEARQKVRSEQKTDVSTNKQLFIDRKEHERGLRKMKNQIADMEHEIARKEAVLENYAKKMENPEELPDMSENPDFYKNYELEKQELEKLMHRWEELNLQLEQAEQQMP